MTAHEPTLEESIRLLAGPGTTFAPAHAVVVLSYVGVNDLSGAAQVIARGIVRERELEAEVARLRAATVRPASLPELPPHYAVAQGPESGELTWYVEHGYIDVGPYLDGFGTRDEAVDAAWGDFRESCPEWWGAMSVVAESEHLREQVAFFRGCAEAAAQVEAAE